jgi:hypothetical protein
MLQKQDKNRAVLFLTAMSGINKNFEEPVIMLRHANDWLIKHRKWLKTNTRRQR